MKNTQGQQLPMGVTVQEDGVSFSVAAKKGKACCLLLYHAGEKEPCARYPMRQSEGAVYLSLIHILSGTHLGIVAEVNSLSRAISAGRMSLEEAQKRLKEIDKIEPIHPGVQIIGAGFASGCLGYLLGATARESVVAFFIGCILYCWVLLARRYHMSKIISNIAGGVIITGLALAAREVSWLAPVQLNGMIIGALMPLVPGIDVYKRQGLYAGRSRLSVLILEKGQDGGQIAITDEIENYPGQIVDCLLYTSDIILMSEALDIVKKKLVNVIAELAKFADEHKNLPTLAFTHFQPAQPTTV